MKKSLPLKAFFLKAYLLLIFALAFHTSAKATLFDFTNSSALETLKYMPQPMEPSAELQLNGYDQKRASKAATDWYTLSSADVVVENGIIISCAYDFSISKIIIPDTLDDQAVIGIQGFEYIDVNGDGVISSDDDLELQKQNASFAAKALMGINFPVTLMFIGENAFRENNITELNINDCTALQSIGENAFYGNFQLSGIVLPVLSNKAFVHWLDTYDNIFLGGDEIINYMNAYVAQFDTLNSDLMTYVPDDHFEQALIDLGYDSGDLNDSVPTANIFQITELDISKNLDGSDDEKINNLTGIEDFKALEVLDCYANDLSVLDIRENRSLLRLTCTYNAIERLDLSENNELEYLSCGSNQLNNLDLSSNSVLRSLSCFGNNISALDLSANEALYLINCHSNNLSRLDVSENTELTSLICFENQIKTLDLSHHHRLILLECYGNQLNAVDLKNGNNHQMTDTTNIYVGVFASGNPDLTCLQVDDATLAKSYPDWEVDETTIYSEDCGYINHAPLITSTAPTTATVGIGYSYTIIASDEDGDLLTYTLLDAPDGMTIDGNIISWTPDEAAILPGEITLTVDDGELSDTERLTIELISIYNNQAMLRLEAIVDEQLIHPAGVDYTFYKETDGSYEQEPHTYSVANDRTAVVVLDAGNWIIRANPVHSTNNFLATYFGDVATWADASMITVEAGVEASYTVHCIVPDDRLAGEFSIRGYVYQSHNSNKSYVTASTKTENSEPFEGVLLELFADEAAIPLKSCTTDADGYYEFTALADGSYSVEVDVPGFAQDAQYSVEIGATNPQDSIVFLAYMASNLITDSEDFGFHEVFVYPNPVHSYLSIKSKREIKSIEVISIDGSVLFKKSDCAFIEQLNLQNLLSGTYVVRIRTAEKVVLKKVTKY